ncbi:hypothetical protein ACQPU1_17525 [Clostridium paraputrificum]|uniref:hypothetical protein n=1 Tax=Clostridium TaxID=1485 RepID=UPI003D335E76
MKKFIKLFSITILLLAILILYKNYFGLTRDEAMIQYLIFAAIIIIGSLAFNIIYGLHYSKKINRIAIEAIKGGNIKKSIEENEVLLKKVKGEFLKNLIRLNIAVSYSLLGEFEKGKEILVNDIEVRRLRKNEVLNYYINLATVYFYTKEKEKAINIMRKYEGEFERVEGDPLYGSRVNLLKIYKYIVEKQFDKGKELFIKTKERWPEYLMESDYNKIEEFLG